MWFWMIPSGGKNIFKTKLAKLASKNFFRLKDMYIRIYKLKSEDNFWPEKKLKAKLLLAGTVSEIFK